MRPKGKTIIWVTLGVVSCTTVLWLLNAIFNWISTSLRISDLLFLNVSTTEIYHRISMLFFLMITGAFVSVFPLCQKHLTVSTDGIRNWK